MLRFYIAMVARAKFEQGFYFKLLTISNSALLRKFNYYPSPFQWAKKNPNCEVGICIIQNALAYA